MSQNTKHSRSLISRRGFLQSAGTSLAAGSAIGFPAIVPASVPGQNAPGHRITTGMSGTRRWAFFAFDNGVGRGQWAPERQASVLKELGYDGISYNLTTKEALAHWQRAFRDEGLKLYGLYVRTWVDAPQRFQSELREAIEVLKGSDTIIWMTLQGGTDQRGQLDPLAMENVRQVAEWAAKAGLRVALYPHVNYYVETTEDALRIYEQLDSRQNVDISFNLCHELMKGNADRLDEIIKKSAAYLSLISINGADVPTRGFIQRLDHGSFDVTALLAAFKAAGYRGPVGLQCFNIQGDTEANLKASMAAWNIIKKTIIAKGIEK